MHLSILNPWLLDLRNLTFKRFTHRTQVQICDVLEWYSLQIINQILQKYWVCFDFYWNQSDIAFVIKCLAKISVCVYKIKAEVLIKNLLEC